MSENPLQLITSSIENANAQFESAWSSVLELSKFINAEEDITVASHRLLSYNPQNKIVSSTNKNLSNAVNIISNFVIGKLDHVSKNPEDYNSWSTLAKCYLMLNDFPNAYTCVAHVIKLNENFQDSTFWYVAGIVNQHFNYHQEALRFYRMSAQLEPRAPHIGDLNFRLAILYRSLNKPDDALPLFKQALDSLPHNLTVDDIKFQIAFTYQVQKQTDRANQIYSELLRAHPRSLELNQQYTWFLSLSSDPATLELAEKIATSAEEQYPNDPVLKFALACISLRQQITTEAYRRYRECLQTWSDSPLFWCGLGILYLKNEQFQDAIVAFQRALFLRSDITEAWLNFGLIFQRQNRHDEALKIYQTALSNCNMAQQIQDRINAIKSSRGPGSMVPNYDICEINGDKLVTQVAEKVSFDYCADLPNLSVKAMGIPHEHEAAFELALSALYSPHASIF